jgi:putative transposase
MARIARVVLPGIPHHVVQRGVRSQRLFFSDPDRGEYLRLLAEQGRRYGLLYVAWCLMPNHVHLIVIPETETSLAKGIGEAHKAYTRRINFRQATRGYLFQGRFASCPLDERHLFAAVRYALRNPVRAGLVADPADYPWSTTWAGQAATLLPSTTLYSGAFRTGPLPSLETRRRCPSCVGIREQVARSVSPRSSNWLRGSPAVP